jgi:hypothetical protein
MVEQAVDTVVDQRLGSPQQARGVHPAREEEAGTEFVEGVPELS